MRFAALVSVLLLSLTAPVLAQEGTWETTGTHSTRGAFTGTVTYSRYAAGWAQFFRAQGSYSFEGDDRVFAWTGVAWAAGDKVQLWNRYDTPGLVGRLEGRGGVQRGHGSYTLAVDADGKQTLQGGWKSTNQGAGAFEVTETLSLSDGVDSGDGNDPDAPSDDDDEDLQQVEVNLTLLAADGSEIADADEETKGMVVSTNIDDDDRDGGDGGHSQNALISDKDDTDGVSGEDDMIEIKLAQPQDAPDGSSFRLTFGERIAVWRNADKTERVVSGETKLDPKSVTLYVEGLSATKAGEGETLTLELVKGSRTLGSDKATIHTTGSAFLLVGHGCTGEWSLKSMLRSRAVDSRKDPTIVESEKGGYWSVYIWESQKLAKLALLTEGAVISYDGHSNYGMGFAFETGFRTLDQFMNIADPQIPVNWQYLREHQSHPRLMFDKKEYGDDASTRRRYDPMKVSHKVRGTNGNYGTSRYPTRGGSGSRMRLTEGRKRYLDRHYGKTDNYRIVVKAGAADMPAKRWSALFLNSCYSGQYYSDSFGGQGTLFFTHESASASRTSGQFILGTIDGKSNDEILETMNDAENVHDYVVNQ